MTISIVGAGAPEYGNNLASFTPPLHANVVADDYTVGVFYMDDETSNWGSAPAGWTMFTGFPMKGGLTNGEINLAVCWRRQPATPEAPTLTQDQAGAGSITSYTFSFRTDQDSMVLDIIGTLLAVNYGGGGTIGPVSGIGPIADPALVLAIGVHGDEVASHTTLNDGVLSWEQAVHGTTPLGADSASWLDYAVTSGGPTVASQTWSIGTADMTKDSGGILISIQEIAGGDTTAPTLNTATILPGGTTIELAFDETVTIGSGGNGGVALSMSGGAVTATYASGAGTATLTYNLSRTIEAGETGTISYTQPGDGIEDASGNDLATFSGVSVTNSSTVDTTAPTLQSSVIPTTGDSVTFTFDENVTFGAGGNSGFTLSMSGGAVTATYSSGSGTSALVYTLSRVVLQGETGTMAYTQPGDGVEDASGNDLATIASSSVTNNSTETGDTTPPALTSATVAAAGTSVTLNFDEAVTIGAGGNGGVSVSMSGGFVIATYASGSGTAALVYNLHRTIQSGETGTVGYTQPGDGLEDSSGNDVVTFSGSSLTNSSTQSGKTYIDFSGAPPGASEEGLYKACQDDPVIATTPGAGDQWEVDTVADVSYDTEGVVSVVPPATKSGIAYRLYDSSVPSWSTASTVTWAEEPSLTLPTLTATGQTTMDLSVTTDVDTGTIYWYVSTSVTQPSVADLKAGTGADDFGSIAVSSVGAKTDSAAGLVASTIYYLHALHTNTVDSEIVTSQGVATDSDAVSVTIAGTLPGVSGQLAAAALISSAVTGQLPGISGEALLDALASAGLAGSLPGVSGALVGGALVSGLLQGTLPGVSGTMAAEAIVAAGLQGVLPSLTGTVAISATDVRNVSVAGTLPGMSGQLQTLELAGATLAGTLPSLSGVLQASAPAGAMLAGTLPSLSGQVLAAVLTDLGLAGALPSLSGPLSVERVASAILAGELRARTLNTVRIVTGYDIAFSVQLYLKADGAAEAAFDMSGKAAKARLVSLNHKDVYSDDVTLREAATGADWSTSLVVVEFPSASTAAITYQGDVIVEIQVEMPEKKPFFLDAHIIRGHSA